MSKFSEIANTEKFAVVMLLLVTLFWGLTFPVIKVTLDHISPTLFVAIRFTIATLLLIPFILKQIRTADKQSLIAGFILGMIVFFAFTAQTLGLKFTTATKSAFITGLVVIMIPLFQIFIERKLPSPMALFGVLLALPGIMFLTSEGNSIEKLINELGSGFNIGDFITFICAVLYTIYVLYLDNVSKKYSTRLLVFMQVAVSAVAGIFFALILDFINVEKMFIEYHKSLFIGLGYTGLIVTAMATIIQTKFQKAVTPTEAGIIYSFEPVFAATFAYFILSEKITNFGLIGCLLIFAGLFVTQVFGKKNGKNGKS